MRRHVSRSPLLSASSCRRRRPARGGGAAVAQELVAANRRFFVRPAQFANYTAGMAAAQFPSAGVAGIGLMDAGMDVRGRRLASVRRRDGTEPPERVGAERSGSSLRCAQINLPVPPLLRQERAVDLLILLDNSADIREAPSLRRVRPWRDVEARIGGAGVHTNGASRRPAVVRRECAPAGQVVRGRAPVAVPRDRCAQGVDADGINLLHAGPERRLFATHRGAAVPSALLGSHPRRWALEKDVEAEPARGRTEVMAGWTRGERGGAAEPTARAARPAKPRVGPVSSDTKLQVHERAGLFLEAVSRSRWTNPESLTGPKRAPRAVGRPCMHNVDPAADRR